jgi:enterochelin esterase family protein
MLACIAALLLQQAPPLVSPEVREDGQVTFRLRAPKAQQVSVVVPELKALLGGPSRAMEKDAQGVWSLTVGPVPPGIYDQSFEVDGLRIVDPSSENVFGNRRGARGFLEVPGPKGSPRHDEWRDVPHGTVTAHWYASAPAGGARRRVHVYTPPGYSKEKDRRYPVLFLLHGSGDNDSHWSVLGRANVVADNLAADGKCRPMVIVMPDGHVPIPPKEGETPEARRERAGSAFERDLLDHVLPLVEAEYRVRTDRESRGIAGLSMGGGQALGAGLRNLDRFAWVGGFSSATRGWNQGVPGRKLEAAEANERLKLLWIAIGKEDFLIEPNRGFAGWLKESGFRHTYLETEGAHTWSVWRRYLADFLPLLF